MEQKTIDKIYEDIGTLGMIIAIVFILLIILQLFIDAI